MYTRLLCRLLIVISSYASAQQCTTSVLINVFDAKTKTPLRGLRASDFAASSGRAELTVDNVRPVFRNRVVVLLDLSGQPDGMSRETLLQNTLDYITEAPQSMPVAFGAFAENAVFTRGFSADPASLSSSLQLTRQRATSLNGRPNLPHALRLALAMFEQHRDGDTILLISNGNVRVSRAQWNSLARDFSRRHTRLQLLTNSPVVSATDVSTLFAPFAVADQMNSSLLKLANRTGGVLMGFLNSEWYSAAASGYLLELRESQRTRLKNWRLRVRNYGEEFGVEPVLFYPRQLPACSTPLVASADLKP